MPVPVGTVLRRKPGTGRTVGTTPIAEARQWMRGETEIPAADGDTYTTVSADGGGQIRLRITSSNIWGSSVRLSAPIEIGLPTEVAPTNDAPPVLGGAVSIGASPTVTPGVWSGTAPITYLYTLRRDGVDITGLVDVPLADVLAYEYVEADTLASGIDFVERATNAAGTATAASNSLRAIGEAVGVQGFSDASTDSYYALTDSTPLPVNATMTVGCMFRLDALQAKIRTLFGRGNANPGWRLALTGANALIYRDSGSATLTYQMGADDVGKTFIVLATRGATNRIRLMAYRVEDDTVTFLASTTTVPSPNSGTALPSIGRTDANQTAENVTIIACAYGTSELSEEQAIAYVKEARATGTLPTTLPGAVSVYQAPELETDQVGSNHMTKYEAGGALAPTAPFVPEYLTRPAWRVVARLGQSNNRGSALLSAVPTGYTANFANAKLFNNEVVAARLWGDLRPLGDDQWGPELSFGRQMITDGETAPLHIFKHAIGGVALAEGWNADDPENLGATLIQTQSAWATAVRYAVGTTGPTWSPFALPEVIAVSWIQGEADSTVEARADAYQASLNNLINHLRGFFPINAVEFLWIDSLLPAFNLATYKGDVNAAKTALRAIRADMVLIDTDALPDEGDDLHYSPDSYIQLGLAEAEAWDTRADVTAVAP